VFTHRQEVSYESTYSSMRTSAPSGRARFIQRHELWSVSVLALHVCGSRKEEGARISNDAWNVYNDTSAFTLYVITVNFNGK